MRTMLLWTAAVVSALLSLGWPLGMYWVVEMSRDSAQNFADAAWFAGTFLSVTTLTVVWLRPTLGDWIPTSVLAASALPNLAIIVVKYGFLLAESVIVSPLYYIAAACAILIAVFCPFYTQRISRLWGWRTWGYTFLSLAIFGLCALAYYWPLTG